MFIAAPFTIAKTGKQPTCPSAVEWIKTMWSMYTTEYYSSTRKNEITPFVTCTELEVVILSKVSQKEKDKYRIIPLICRI